MGSLKLEFLMLTFAGWVNRSQQNVIEYLQEENRLQALGYLGDEAASAPC